MLETILITLLIVAICIVLLSIRILFRRGKFPNTHVSGNKALRKKGIGCVQSQDREAQRKNKLAVKEKEHPKDK